MATSSLEQLQRRGYTRSRVRAQLDGRRWRRLGRAVVLHNGPLSEEDRRQVALINAGPRALLSAFTAAQCVGLVGWERRAVHVLVPRGARVRRVPQVDVRVHVTSRWDAVERRGRDLEAPAGALVRAAGGFRRARPACGLLAAGVQQRIVTADELADQLQICTRVRHHASLVLAVQDIGQGAHALSELDFAVLCRRARLPEPARQAVRVQRDGRRRYLDVEWVLPGGRRVVVEVDGALHLIVRQWWDDQVRQNELALTGDLVLRYPSVVVRDEPELVVAQLRRALLCR